MEEARRCLLSAIALSVLFGFGSTGAEERSQLPKAYFGSTAPGAWARYDQTTTDQNGKASSWAVTISRLENEGDRVWMEVRRVPKPGSAGKATTVKYLLKPDFKLDKDTLNYMNFIDRAIVQEDGKSAVEMPWDLMRGVMGSGLTNIDYTSSVMPQGSERVGNRLCDRYHLHGTLDVRVMFASVKGAWEADLWMSDAVPFGRVKESSVTRDESGKLLGKTDWTLVETGSGAKSQITGEIRKMR
jgi:hypothetical protein